MVVGQEGQGKAARRRWIKPPWTQDSPQWQDIDRDLPIDHLARQIDNLVNMLDLSELYATYQNVGSRAYRPELMMKLVLYELRLGKKSPAEWARDVIDSRPVQWLGMGIRPSRSRLYDFRRRAGKVIDSLNAQVLQHAIDLKLTSARRAALDGTAVAANASRHKLITAKTLERRMAELTQAVTNDKFGQTEVIVCPGKPVRLGPAWMGRTSRGRKQQQQRYQQACLEMQKRQEQNRKRPSGKRQDAAKIRISTTDPKAVLGRDKEKVYRPLYNVQWLVDLDSPLILAADVFAQPNDNGTLEPMLQRCSEWTGTKPEQLLADATYANAMDLALCESAGVEMFAPYQENDHTSKKRALRARQQIPKDAFTWLQGENTYRCPEGHHLVRVGRERKHRSGDRSLEVISYRCPSEHCSACPRQTACTSNPSAGRMVKRSEHEDLLVALKRRMQTPEAKLLYSLRKQTVELAFADLKENRKLRRFSGRGLEVPKAEIGLLVLAHNALIVQRALKQRNKSSPAPVNPDKIAA